MHGSGEWESGGVGEWGSGGVGEWGSGRVGEWESGRVGEWEKIDHLTGVRFWHLAMASADDRPRSTV